MSNSPSDAKERVLFEGQRVTIIANAAGALALLAFLQSIWMQAGAISLKRAVLWGIAAFAIGAGVALVGYVARYWALSKNQVTTGLYYQIAHLWIPLVAVVCFVLGLIIPVAGGLDSVGGQQERPTQTVPKRR
jgi:hypothetical protein